MAYLQKQNKEKVIDSPYNLLLECPRRKNKAYYTRQKTRIPKSAIPSMLHRTINSWWNKFEKFGILSPPTRISTMNISLGKTEQHIFIYLFAFYYSFVNCLTILFAHLGVYFLYFCSSSLYSENFSLFLLHWKYFLLICF